MHPAVEQIRQYLQLIALQFVQHPTLNSEFS